MLYRHDPTFGEHLLAGREQGAVLLGIVGGIEIDYIEQLARLGEHPQTLRRVAPVNPHLTCICAESLDVVADRLYRLGIPVQQNDPCRSSRQRLQADRATPRERIQEATTRDHASDHVEERTPNPRPSGTRGHSPRSLELPPLATARYYARQVSAHPGQAKTLGPAFREKGSQRPSGRICVDPVRIAVRLVPRALEQIPVAQ